MSKALIHKTIDINAPKEKVWDMIVEPEFAKEWLAISMPGATVEGDFSLDGTVRYVDPQNNGIQGTVKEYKLYKKLFIIYDSMIVNGVVDNTDPSYEDWNGTTDLYELSEDNGVTHVVLENLIPEKEKDFFDKVWGEVLVKIKEMAEKHV